jgi:hypothetical protein
LNNPTEAEFIEHLRVIRPNVIDGFIKLKLVHAEGMSLLIPDLLAVDFGGMRWFQAKFFYAPMLSFWDGYAAADICIEISGGILVNVCFTSGGFVASLCDSSHVYRCVISNAADLTSSADGTCSLEPSGDFRLDLFHHTTDQAAEAIQASGRFLGSNWNVQGTRELKNINYAYFTSLKRITSEQDLAKISMASTGFINLLKTNAASSKEAISLKVYRQSTTDRTATVPVSVSASLVASQHVYLHATRGQAVYYEICNPDIYRVGLQPGEFAPMTDGVLNVPEANMKRFEYMVLGDADTEDGLIAPFDEEETKSLLHIETCAEQSLFDFWRAHANSDQVAGRAPELLAFKDGNQPDN